MTFLSFLQDKLISEDYMRFEEHCQECIIKLGKPYEEVHKWLDEFAGKKPHGMHHRQFRHHRQGITDCCMVFGEEACEPTKLHIISNLRMEGWTEDDGIPANEKDYLRMGLF